jgi:hypothetical protein
MNAEGPNPGNAAKFSTNDNMNVARRSKVAVKSYHFYLLFGCNYLRYIPLIKTCWFIFAVYIEVALNFIYHVIQIQQALQ